MTSLEMKRRRCGFCRTKLWRSDYCDPSCKAAKKSVDLLSPPVENILKDILLRIDASGLDFLGVDIKKVVAKVFPE